MYSFEFPGINALLIGISQALLEKGVKRMTRGQVCHELSGPVMIKMTSPQSRIVTIEARKWNCFAAYAESLWIALGRNDLAFMRHYLRKLQEFSDDTQTIRAGYGPRIRRVSLSSDDYFESGNLHFSFNKENGLDQFEFIEKVLCLDRSSRRAVIDIGDPMKDCLGKSGNLKETKDFPCTRSLQFVVNCNGDLDLIVHMRSNDFMWGATAVNIFNYSYMLEYFSAILSIPMGNYYHIVNNLHFYDYHLSEIKRISEYPDPPLESTYVYQKSFSNLKEFNQLLFQLEAFENELRKGKSAPFFTEDHFFSDWGQIFFAYAKKSAIFHNPLLQDVVNRSLQKK